MLHNDDQLARFRRSKMRQCPGGAGAWCQLYVAQLKRHCFCLQFVLFEIENAISLDKKIMLMHESDPRHGTLLLWTCATSCPKRGSVAVLDQPLIPTAFFPAPYSLTESLPSAHQHTPAGQFNFEEAKQAPPMIAELIGGSKCVCTRAAAALVPVSWGTH